jgi:hypothetical protein
VRQAESDGPLHRQHETQQRRQLLDVTSKAKDFLSEFQFGEVRPVQTHDDRHRFDEPPASGRSGDTEIRCDADIARPANQISQAVVIASLRAAPARHTDDHQPARSCPSAPPSENTVRSATGGMVLGIGDDISRRQVQNIRGNSSAQILKHIAAWPSA